MICHCGKKFTKGRIAPGPVGWTEKQVQYCGTCNQMSHVIQGVQVVKYGPLNARSPQNAIGKADGTVFIDWWTTNPGEIIQTMEYSPYPTRSINGMDQGRNHLMKFWHDLDACIDKIRGFTNPEGKMEFVIGEDAEIEKIRASTYAEVLAHLMAPFYADKNAVLAESLHRYNARKIGQDHQSPGLAEHIWDPSSRFEGTAYSQAAEKQTRTRTATKPAVKLDDQKIAFVNHCLQQETMSVSQLAKMFDCSEDDIKAVVK